MEIPQVFPKPYSYVVCTADSASKLALEVQSRKAEGYACVGGLTFDGTNWHQAMER